MRRYANFLDHFWALHTERVAIEPWKPGSTLIYDLDWVVTYA